MMNCAISRKKVSVALMSMALVACAPVITSKLADRGEMDNKYSYNITADQNPKKFDAIIPPPKGLTVDQNTGNIAGVPSEAGVYQIPISASNAFGSDEKILHLTIDPPKHPVVREKELFIIDPSVVQDSKQAQPGGSWHIRSLMQRLAGEGVNVDDFANAWFEEWSTDQDVNGDKAKARARTASALKSAWMNDRFRLIAIVNRIDLTRFEGNDPDGNVVRLGEGRLIYEMLTPQGDSVQNFTVIFEFALPVLGGGNLNASLELWAQRWHLLGRESLGDSHTFGSEYLNELEDLVGLYTAHGQINQVRTNDFITTSAWELREFSINQDQLDQRTVAQTPKDSLNGQSDLKNFIDDQKASILNGTHEVPLAMLGAKSEQPSNWHAPGADSRASFIVAFNTCNGCHTSETGTGFQMIEESRSGRPANLAAFLTGTILTKELLPKQTDKSWNEMAEREKLLAHFSKDELVALSREDLNSMIAVRSSRVH